MNTFKSVLLAMVVLVAIAYANPDNPGYLNVHPHPYLVLSLVLGATFGLFRAIFSGSLIAGVYLYFLHLETRSDLSELVVGESNFALPLTIFALPLFLGAITTFLRNKIVATERDAQEHRHNLQKMEKIHQELKDDKKFLETNKRSRIQTVSRILEYATVLETNDLDEIGKALVDLTCEQIGESNCYLYVQDEDQFRRLAHRDDRNQHLPKYFCPETLSKYAVIMACLEKKKLIKTQDLNEASVNSEENTLAAPLLTEMDSTIGFMVIPRLSFINYLPVNFTNFEAISRWGAICISRASRLSSLRESSYRDDVTGLFSFPYFRRRGEAEFHLSKKFSLPLTCLRFEIPQISKISAIQRIPVLKIFSDALESMARPTDTIAIDESPHSLYVLMMLASQSEVKSFQKRIEESFAEMKQALSSAISLQLNIYKTEIKREHKDFSQFLNEQQAC